MAQDIKKLMKEQSKTSTLTKGHDDRFAAKLDKAFSVHPSSTKKSENHPLFWLKIAAVVVVIFGLGYVGFQQFSKNNLNSLADTPIESEENDKSKVAQISIGDISPDLKKVENFYLAGINAQLASLETDGENKELIDGYMQRLDELATDYKLLNKELNDVGPTEATITALIDNLKLRLELLFKLKNKLKELKNLENEQFSNIEA